MTSYRTEQVPGWAAVMLEGPTNVLRDAQASLRIAGLDIESVGKNSIVLRDVRESAIINITAVAESYGLRIAGKFGDKTFLHRTAIQQRKAFKLNVEPNKWYFAENIEKTFPFVLVRDAKIEAVGSNGDTDQILDLEFYGPNHAMPIRQTVSSREAAQYGLRPATEDDFNDADMIVPLSEFSTIQLPASPSHGIPTDKPPVDEKPKPIPGQL
jgi:hypothetical protein